MTVATGMSTASFRASSIDAAEPRSGRSGPANRRDTVADACGETRLGGERRAQRTLASPATAALAARSRHGWAACRVRPNFQSALQTAAAPPNRERRMLRVHQHREELQIIAECRACREPAQPCGAPRKTRTRERVNGCAVSTLEPAFRSDRVLDSLRHWGQP